MNRPNKLTSQHRAAEQEQTAAQQQTQHPSTLEFADADELLRHDARQTTVPPGIIKRLATSLTQTPAPTTSWWRRWFGGPNS